MKKVVNSLKGNMFGLEFSLPSGHLVRTLFSEEKAAGYYDLSVPVSSLSAGSYFLRLETRNKAVTRKVIKGGE